MSDPKLIAIYAGYGDSLLLKIQPPGYPTPRTSDWCMHDYTTYESLNAGFWLIDGGPITSTAASATAINGTTGLQQYNAYYQYLRQAVRRFCSSGATSPDGSLTIDLLDGIIVTHPDRDHMDGRHRLRYVDHEVLT